jgi:hypothetical protein
MVSRAVALAPFLVVVACSSAPSAEPIVDTSPVVSAPQSAGACVIHVRYETAECEACMQQQCCAETEACFTNDDDCAALHSCTAACPAAPPNFFIPMGGDGGAATPDDEGNACVTACEAAHPASVNAHRGYDSCIRARCMPACAGH